MSITRARLLSPLLLLSLVVVAGCGSSSSSSSSSSTSPAATSTTAGAPAAQTVQIATKHSKVGTVLDAGPKHLTVYLFEADKGGKSSCSGKCAASWPPVLGSGKATGKAVSSDLGTIKRADGKTQVTYKGHPLYYFAKDKDDEDAYGEGVKAFGAGWYVLAPSGKKIDES